MRRVGRRIFELFVRAFPARFRERHLESMREAFDAGLREHGARGRLTLLAFLLRSSVDMLVAGMGERLGRGPAGSAHGSPTRVARSPRLASWLDVKLGLRMLVRNPALTVVAVAALAIGIPVGLAPWHVAEAFEAPLPVPGGERVRLLRLWSTAESRSTQTTALELEQWSATLGSFEALGAVRTAVYNLGSEEGSPGDVAGAQVTPSTFSILRGRALLGRGLVEADAAVGAEDVVVLGHDVWRSRFAGDPGIVGRTVRVGATPHTVVGVMDEGFRFPIRQQLWLPLRVRGDVTVPVRIFGRLAEGVGDAEAQAEMTALGARLEAELPGRYERVQPEVVPFVHVVVDAPRDGLRGVPGFYAVQALTLLLLVIACANVGLLIFARTVNRSGELAVRTALGASRGRIVGQIFSESLVLAVLACGAGLLLLDTLIRVLPLPLIGALPYWIDLGVTPQTVGWGLGLAVGSAAVAGVVPAWRVTGRAIRRNLRRAGAGRSGVRFGGLTGALIVLDVAIAVAAIGFALSLSDVVRGVGADPGAVGVPAEEYLSAGVALPGSSDATGGAEGEERARRASTQLELVRRLRDEPGVRDVGLASHVPRMDHPIRRVEVEGRPQAPEGRGYQVRSAQVHTDFFASLGHAVLQGRGFERADVTSPSLPVIVNTTFVRNVLGGRDPIGARLRYRGRGEETLGPWHEVIGVVDRLGTHVLVPELDQSVYHPLAPGELATVRLAIHLGEDPGAFAPRLREIAAEVDPTAVVRDPLPMDEIYEGDWYLLRAMVWGGGALVGILIALAASGIYAIVSFSVAERTREIGVRAAMGARRASLVRTVIGRALAQLALGVALGAPLGGLLFGSQTDSVGLGIAAGLLPGVGVVALVGLVACTAPTLRALRVMPSEALRSDG